MAISTEHWQNWLHLTAGSSRYKEQVISEWNDPKAYSCSLTAPTNAFRLLDIYNRNSVKSHWRIHSGSVDEVDRNSAPVFTPLRSLHILNWALYMKLFLFLALTLCLCFSVSPFLLISVFTLVLSIFVLSLRWSPKTLFFSLCSSYSRHYSKHLYIFFYT